MAFEVKFIFHPRKEDGTYNQEVKEEKVVKIGKPFEDIPLENLAASIMSQMARRDIWVTDVEVSELVRREVCFKECKDGKGIILKNRKFSFNESAQMVAEDVTEGIPCVEPQQIPAGMYPHEIQAMQAQQVQQPQQLPPGMYPHEVAAMRQPNLDDLFSNPNKVVPVIKQNVNKARALINPKKKLYEVYFEPDLRYQNEVRQLGLKFKPDVRYPVHQIIPSPTGRLDAQKLAITDDTGRIVEVDEKYFTSAGLGLMEDKRLNFSEANNRSAARRPKLAFENEMYMDSPDPQMAIMQGVPADSEYIPDELLAVPDIRAKRR
jgi:hypothetical protein